MTSPGLIHGTFGGRRGPLFITLCALFFAWILARWRLPKWRTIGLVMLAIVAAVVFIQSQRRKVYLGSENKVDVNRFVELVRAPELSEGDNFVFSAGDILVTHETEFFHWGRTFVMNYVVRPVPKQLWPSKYDDAAEYLYGGGQTDLSDADWLRTVGWIPLSGSASNLVADLYAEFSWGAILGCWLLGRFIGVTWRNFRVRGGFWVFMYMCVGILSVYLPTQSFSAFFHRFLYMNIVTYLLWRYWMHPRDRMARPLRLQSVSPRKGVLKSQVSRELKAK